MEFLVEFEGNVPNDAKASEVEARNRAEASAASRLVDAATSIAQSTACRPPSPQSPA
jgi:hypothetical protein